jgi:hypothetical protein
VQSNFSRMFDQFLFKHNFVSAFPHRPTDCSKTEVMNCFSIWDQVMYPLSILLYSSWDSVCAKICTNYSQTYLATLHCWQHYIERIDGWCFSLIAKHT